MRHRKYEQLIVLQLYGELEEDEKGKLERHVQGCGNCARFMERAARIPPKGMARAGEIPGIVADQARKEAMRSLSVSAKGNRSGSAAFRFSGKASWYGRGIPVYATASVGVLMFAVGVISAYLFIGRGPASLEAADAVISQMTSGNLGDEAVTDVRFLDSDKKSGEVQFSFNLVRRYDMKGSLDDRNVQKILAFALVNSDNPGVRLRTIGMLDATPEPDNEIIAALVKAVKSDENAGVRREALLSLERFHFVPEIKNAFLYVLQNDKNPGMRVAAINFLAGRHEIAGSGSEQAKRPDPALVNVLREKSSSDPNGYVRMKAADILKEMKEL